MPSRAHKNPSQHLHAANGYACWRAIWPFFQGLKCMVNALQNRGSLQTLLWRLSDILCRVGGQGDVKNVESW